MRRALPVLFLLLTACVDLSDIPPLGEGDGGVDASDAGDRFDAGRDAGRPDGGDGGGGDGGVDGGDSEDGGSSEDGGGSDGGEHEDGGRSDGGEVGDGGDDTDGGPRPPGASLLVPGTGFRGLVAAPEGEAAAAVREVGAGGLGTLHLGGEGWTAPVAVGVPAGAYGFSPDGRYLVAAERPQGGAPRLRLVTAASGTPSRILAGGLSEESWLWSPTGNRVLYPGAAKPSGFADLLFAPTGSGPPLTVAADTRFAPQLSGDGSFALIVDGLAGDAPDLVLLDLATAATHVVGSGVRQAVVDPFANYVVWVHQDGRLFRVRVYDDFASEELASAVAEAAVSSSGAVAYRTGGALLLDLNDGTEPEQLATGISGVAPEFADYRWVLYFRSLDAASGRGSLFAVREGAAPVELMSDCAPGAFHRSSDGRWLAVHGGPANGAGRLRLFDLHDDSLARPARDVSNVSHGESRFSLDGSGLLYRTAGGTLYQLRTETSTAARAIATAVAPGAFGFVGTDDDTVAVLRGLDEDGLGTLEVLPREIRISGVSELRFAGVQGELVIFALPAGPWAGVWALSTHL